MSEREEYIYAGVPTFMGGQLINKKEIKNYDVVFLGVPCDYGASYRLGAKYAPRQLREYSFWDRIDGQVLFDIDHNEVVYTNSLKVADIGDVDINPTNPEANQRSICKSTHEIRKYCLPVICGGDHSITYGSFIGVVQAIHELDPDCEVGIIHFDAHLDVEQEYLNMPEVWHGNVFRKLLEGKYLKGDNLYTIGIRGVVDKKWYDYEVENQVNLVTANDVKKNGLLYYLDLIKQNSRNRNIKYYISLDIDGIDMSYIFGTGTPQFNGLSPYEVNEALTQLRPLDICGFDIVELNPTLDDSHSSFVIACELIYHFLAMGYSKKGALQ